MREGEREGEEGGEWRGEEMRAGEREGEEGGEGRGDKGGRKRERNECKKEQDISDMRRVDKTSNNERNK